MSAKTPSSSSSPLLPPSGLSSSSCVRGQLFTRGRGCRSFDSPEITDTIGTLCAEEQLCRTAEFCGGKTTDTIVQNTVPTNGRGTTNPGSIQPTRATFAAKTTPSSSTKAGLPIDVQSATKITIPNHNLNYSCFIIISKCIQQVRIVCKVLQCVKTGGTLPAFRYAIGTPVVSCHL